MTTRNKKTPAKPPRTAARVRDEKSAGSIDNRVHHRIPVQLLVDYRSDGHYLFDFCKDLGVGGVFIQTSEPLPMGSEISLTFTLPDSKETLDAKGTVIWAQSVVAGRSELTPGMGVQFHSFAPEQRRLLEEFVSRYNKQHREPPKSA